MNGSLDLATLQPNLDHDGAGYRGHDLAGLRAAGVPEVAILVAVKANAKGCVDEVAERLRASLSTPGVGQAMEYLEVQAQAFAAIQATSPPTAELYPMLAATIGVDVDPDTGAPATDLLGVARAIRANYRAWNTAGSAIRAARLKGKAAIEAAGTVEAVKAAYDAIPWPALG